VWDSTPRSAKIAAGIGWVAGLGYRLYRGNDEKKKRRKGEGKDDDD
jgi:hypothetical protein